MAPVSGVRLEREGDQADLTSLDEINALLSEMGTRIWKHHLSGLSKEPKEFLADPNPSREQIAKAKPYFLLSRKRV